MREFEIYPGWMGGAGRRTQYEPNTRLKKAYSPTWREEGRLAGGHDHYLHTGLYPPASSR